jgi:transposase InsO family protein
MPKRFILSLAVGLVAALAIGYAASARTDPAADTHSMTHMASDDDALAGQLAAARLATGKYATDLDRAKADGYGIITRMVPDMGWHFMNPKIQKFDPRRPPILVYERRGHSWQLGALEWVFPETPATPPFPGAQYGSFPAACHYVDGTFVPADSQDQCKRRSPQSGAKFNFWHGPLVTLHVWVWYHNPDGLFASMNPLVRPFN